MTARLPKLHRGGAVCVASLAIVCSSGLALAAPLPGTHTKHDRAVWRNLLHWPASCQSSWRASHAPGAGIQKWSRSNGRHLVAVTCAMGAYQGNSMLYLLDASHHTNGARTLHLYRDPGNGTPTATHTKRPLGQLSFRHTTSILWIFDRFRSIGDCGISSKFRLSGSQFVPTVSRAKTACDGNGPFDPNQWATLPLLSP